MYRYILKRILLNIPVLFGIILVITMILHFSPGDTARSVLGAEASEEAIELYREEMGLNDPYVVQLFRYIGNLLRGDFGVSLRSKGPVINDIMERFPNTARLALLGVLFGVVLGVVTGILSAVKQYSIWDRVASMIALFGVATPTFWLALMLVLLTFRPRGLLGGEWAAH